MPVKLTAASALENYALSGARKLAELCDTTNTISRCPPPYTKSADLVPKHKPATGRNRMNATDFGSLDPI